MKVIFEDGQFSFQTLRLLSEVPSGQADINEVVETARRIPEGILSAGGRNGHTLQTGYATTRRNLSGRSI